LKNGEITEREKFDEIVQQISIQAIQQGAVKKVTAYQKKVQEVIAKGNKEEIRKLHRELLRATEKMEANIYQKDSAENASALLTQLEEGLGNTRTTTTADDFP